MTEAGEEGMDREEIPPFASLAAAAARLLVRAIDQADPGDLKELMDESDSEGTAGLVIRIEGDPLDE